MGSKLTRSLLAGLLLLVLCVSSAYAISLQMPFDVGQTWGPRTYDNHNCWGPYDDKTHAIDWFLCSSTQSTCPYWSSTYTYSEGQNLRAACAGTVYMMQYDSTGYGNYLVIQSSEDPTYFTLYAHMETYKSGLAVGQTVNPGDIVGTVGMTGGGSGGFAHLHMELEHGTNSSNWVPQDISQLVIDTQTVSFVNWGCVFNGWISGYFGPPLVSLGSLQVPTYGSITGNVSDTFGSPVVGATVSTNTGGYSGTTDSNGNYTIANVLDGSYTLTASATGYTTGSHNISVVGTGATTSNFALQITNGLIPGTPSGSNMATTATATTDSNYSTSYTGAKAIDGVISSASKWCSTNSTSYHWIQLDLGSMVQVTGFIVYFAGYEGELTGYNWKNFQIQSATSSSGPWVNEANVTNSSQANSISGYFASRKCLRYVRLYVSNCGIDNYARLPEIMVYGVSSAMSAGTPNGTNMATSGTATTDSVYSQSYLGSLAIDGVISVASKWCSANVAPPHWLAVDLGTTRTINGYIVYNCGAAGENTQCNTKNFEIQSGPTINGPWSDEIAVTNNYSNSCAYYYTYYIKPLRYLRLYITNCGIDNYARIPEFQVYCAN